MPTRKKIPKEVDTFEQWPRLLIDGVQTYYHAASFTDHLTISYFSIDPKKENLTIGAKIELLSNFIEPIYSGYTKSVEISFNPDELNSAERITLRCSLKKPVL